MASDALNAAGDFAAHAADAEVAHAACMALNNAFVDDPRWKQHAADAGAVGAVVAAMRRFPRCRDLQRGGCVALQSLFSASRPAELPAQALHAGA